MTLACQRYTIAPILLCVQGFDSSKPITDNTKVRVGFGTYDLSELAGAARFNVDNTPIVGLL